ncbi:MAG: hypothetical protein ACRDGQ_01255 [Candidatus Limnocylindrales bacterium]
MTFRKLPLAIGTDRTFVFDNVGTPDGAWLIGVSQPNEFPQTTKPSEAVLYRVADGTLRTMAQLETPTSQVLAASSDGHWVVWSEAADQPYFYDWRLRAYDITTGAVSELARAVDVNGSPVPGPYPVPSVSNGLAVWGQAVGPMGANPSEMSNGVVREADLATGRISTLATSAGMPVIAWPWITWGVWSGGTGYTRIEDLGTKQISRLDVMPPTIALNGRSAAYNDVESHSVFLIDDVAQSAARLIAQGVDAADHLEWITLNSRLVAWAQSTTTQVYDRAEQRVVALPMTFGRSAVYMCGPLAVWEDFDPGASGQDNPTHLVILDSTYLGTLGAN